MAPTPTIPTAAQQRQALSQFLVAYAKLRGLGWQPMSEFRVLKGLFEVVEPTSMLVFKCDYDEVNYVFTIHPDTGPTFQTFPILWRPLKEQPK